MSSRMLTWVVWQAPPEHCTVRVGKDSKGNSSLDGVHDRVETSAPTWAGGLGAGATHTCHLCSSCLPPEGQSQALTLVIARSRIIEAITRELQRLPRKEWLSLLIEHCFPGSLSPVTRYLLLIFMISVLDVDPQGEERSLSQQWP